VLYTLDKVVQQTLKCLQAMINDDNINKLVGLFVYYRSKDMAAITARPDSSVAAVQRSLAEGQSAVDPAQYQAHVARLLGSAAMEDVYRLQVPLIYPLPKPYLGPYLGLYISPRLQPADAPHLSHPLSDGLYSSESPSPALVPSLSYQIPCSHLIHSPDPYQLLSGGNLPSEPFGPEQYLACQCLGVLGPSGLPVAPAPAPAPAPAAAAAAAASADQVSVCFLALCV
jgi:hypothetical protein